MSESSIDPWLDVAYAEPCYVVGPDDGMIYFGAQPGHSPDRERHDADAGPCPHCRDDIAALMGPDGYCVKCNRWGKDRMLASAIIADAGKRGTAEPVELATVTIVPYAEPFRPSDLERIQVGTEPIPGSGDKARGIPPAVQPTWTLRPIAERHARKGDAGAGRKGFVPRGKRAG